MNSKTWIGWIVAVGIGVSVYYTFFSDSSDSNYLSQITKERKERDQYMRTASDSPFANKPDDFTGLSYFDPNPAYRFTAELEYVKKEPVEILTSDGQSRNYLTYARASFDLGNLRHSLLILEVLDSGPQRGTLFLGFTDETSASETYGAGRYLDLKKVPGATNILLDFNLAYNPYCAYNEQFSCPLPPLENDLKIAIKAGERTYIKTAR